jgi:hypothetical protein
MGKTFKTFSIICGIALVALFLIRCQTTGSAPTGVALVAASDSTVKITWTAPSEGNPDKYIVEFEEVGTNSFVSVDEPVGTATEYIDYPAGKTGTYRVVAKFSSNEYQSDEVTDIPEHTAVVSVSELNATGNSGYGWSRSDGTGSTHSMTEAGNATSVDFYITDFVADFLGPTYSVASPDLGPSDPTNVVPSGAWRANGISTNAVAEQGPLPAHITGNYVSYTDISTDPILLGVWTADGYFALVKASGVNLGQGTVQIETWFQKVSGLRLIQH